MPINHDQCVVVVSAAVADDFCIEVDIIQIYLASLAAYNQLFLLIIVYHVGAYPTSKLDAGDIRVIEKLKPF